MCLLIKSPTIYLSICFHIDRYLVGVFLFDNFNAAILHISAFLKVIVINTFRKKGSTWEWILWLIKHMNGTFVKTRINDNLWQTFSVDIASSLGFIAFRCVYESSLVGWDCADSPPTIGASSPGPILHTHLDHTPTKCAKGGFISLAWRESTKVLCSCHTACTLVTERRQNWV